MSQNLSIVKKAVFTTTALVMFLIWNSCSPAHVQNTVTQPLQNTFPEYGLQTLNNGLQISTALCSNCNKKKYIRYQITQHYVPQGKQKGIAHMTLDFIIHDLENVISANASEFFFDVVVSDEYYNQVLVNLASRLENPEFDHAHFEHVKSNAISFLELDLESPIYQAKDLKRKINFDDGHPYAEVMSPTSLENVTLDDIQAFYKNNIAPNNSLISVVGQFSELEEDAKHIGSFFNTWENRKVQDPVIPIQRSNQMFDIYIMPTQAGVKDVFNIYSYPINYRPGNDDAHLVQILTNALFDTKKGLISQKLQKLGARNVNFSFEPNPVTATLELSYYTNVDDTGIVLDTLIESLKQYRKMELDSMTINASRSRMITSFQHSLNDPIAIQNLRTSQLVHGLDATKARNNIYSTDNLNAEKLKIMHRKYLIPERALHLAVGDVDKLKEQLVFLDENKKLDYLDGQGNPIEIVDQEVPKDITANDVIKGYLEAIGGLDRIQEINDLAKISTASVMGNPAKWATYYKGGNRFAVKMNIDETILFEEKFDGEKFYVFAQNVERVYNKGEEFDKRKESLLPIEQAHYHNDEWDITLEGIEYVDREKCYKVKVIAPSQKTKYQYYNINDFLLVQELTPVSENSGQSNKILQTFADYREVEGIKFPFKTVVRGVGPAPIASIMDTIMVNKGIDPSVFKIE